MIQQIFVRFTSQKMLVAVSTVALCFLVPPAPSVRVHTAPASLRVAPLSMASEAAGSAEELCDIMPASVCEDVRHSTTHPVGAPKHPGGSDYALWPMPAHSSDCMHVGESAVAVVVGRRGVVHHCVQMYQDGDSYR